MLSAREQLRSRKRTKEPWTCGSVAGRREKLAHAVVRVRHLRHKFLAFALGFVPHCLSSWARDRAVPATLMVRVPSIGIGAVLEQLRDIGIR